MPLGTVDMSRMVSRAAVTAALFVCMVMVAALFGAASLEAKMREDKLWLLTGGSEHLIEVEIAETPQEKSLGLMYRTSLPENRGMLFPHHPPQEAAMWMRNTYISLDMIFIRADGVIHRIEARTEPMSERIISSDGPVSAVLELAAGVAEKLGLKAGDRVRHPLFATKSK